MPSGSRNWAWPAAGMTSSHEGRPTASKNFRKFASAGAQSPPAPAPTMATGSGRSAARRASQAEGKPGLTGAQIVLSTGSNKQRPATRSSATAARLAIFAPREWPTRRVREASTKLRSSGAEATWLSKDRTTATSARSVASNASGMSYCKTAQPPRATSVTREVYSLDSVAKPPEKMTNGKRTPAVRRDGHLIVARILPQPPALHGGFFSLTVATPKSMSGSSLNPASGSALT
mmetsp:Transcript_89535/g.289616  ORF Transcript_89535/g.289616 Transcript_89535/m.289616 type:complete len:233 (-) Transcript_89535:458-1156(-)